MKSHSVHFLVLSTLVVLVSTSMDMDERGGLGAPRARFGRSTPPKLSDDLRMAENAVKTELRRESALGTLSTGEYFASALESQNSDAPWWKRLMWYFQNGWGKEIKASLRKAFDEHFVPAVKKGVEQHLLPQLRNQLE